MERPKRLYYDSYHYGWHQAANYFRNAKTQQEVSDVDLKDLRWHISQIRQFAESKGMDASIQWHIETIEDAVQEALEECKKMKGKQFDPQVVDALVGLIHRDYNDDKG